VDVTKVEGYSELSAAAKDLFRRTVARHQAAVGREYKAKWWPVKVQERRDHLRVTFRNGDWLHYWRDGTWG